MTDTTNSPSPLPCKGNDAEDPNTGSAQQPAVDPIVGGHTPQQAPAITPPLALQPRTNHSISSGCCNNPLAPGPSLARVLGSVRSTDSWTNYLNDLCTVTHHSMPTPPSLPGGPSARNAAQAPMHSIQQTPQFQSTESDAELFAALIDSTPDASIMDSHHPVNWLLNHGGVFTPPAVPIPPPPECGVLGLRVHYKNHGFWAGQYSFGDYFTLNGYMFPNKTPSQILANSLIPPETTRDLPDKIITGAELSFVSLVLQFVGVTRGSSQCFWTQGIDDWTRIGFHDRTFVDEREIQENEYASKPFPALPLNIPGLPAGISMSASVDRPDLFAPWPAMAQDAGRPVKDFHYVVRLLRGKTTLHSHPESQHLTPFKACWVDWRMVFVLFRPSDRESRRSFWMFHYDRGCA